MAVQRTALRVVAPASAPVRPAARVATAATVRVAAADIRDVETYKNAVVQAVAYAQQAQQALEDAGRAFNAGTADRAAFEAAQAAFDKAVGTLRTLYAAGKPFNTHWWSFGGFKLNKFYAESGAQALLDYRPPTLGEAPTPGSQAEQVFNLKLEAAKKAAADTVNPEPALTALLKDATTADQVNAILAVGRKGTKDFQSLDYWTSCSSAFFAAAHARLDEIQKPQTLAAKLDSIKAAAADTVNPERALTRLLAEAKTPEEVQAIREVGVKGTKDFISLNYWTSCSSAFFAAVHGRLAALNPPRTFDEKLAAIQKAASDTVNPEPALTKLLGEAQSKSDIDKVLAAGRKGHRDFLTMDYWTECSSALFAAGHTRELQLDLEALAKNVAPADRVKFALQPLPSFPDADSYRNYAVKAASYALLNIQDVQKARAAAKAGTITQNQLKDAEDALELSLKLVAALRQAPSAGFDAAGFWSQYQIEDTAKRVLG